MDITITEKSNSSKEQKTNENGFSNKIVDEVKNFIAEDPYGLFEIKSSASLDQQIKETNLRIELLVKTNTQVKEQVEKFQKQYIEAKTKNHEIIEKMKTGIK